MRKKVDRTEVALAKLNETQRNYIDDRREKFQYLSFKGNEEKKREEWLKAEAYCKALVHENKLTENDRSLIIGYIVL